MRFNTVKAATHAADWANGTLAFGPSPVKVLFSDQSRRKNNIVGDKPSYSLTEKNCHTLLLTYSGNEKRPLPSS